MRRRELLLLAGASLSEFRSQTFEVTVDLAPDRDATKLRRRSPSGDVPAAWTLMAMRGLRWD